MAAFGTMLSMRRPHVLLPGLIAGLFAAPAFGAPEPKDAAAAQRIKVERQAVDLVNRANRRIAQRDQACVPRSPFEDRLPPTQDPVSQAVLDVVAPLRRPAGPQDALPGNASEGFVVGQLYATSVRTLTAADGSRFTMYVARLDYRGLETPPRCRTLARAELRRLVKGQPRALRTRALSLQQHAGRAPSGRSGPRDGIFLFGRDAAGRVTGGGGGGDVTNFRTHGAFNSMGGGGRSARLSGLVPDGVASVTFTFPKRVSRGRNYKPKVYARTVTRTVRVSENVVSLRVPRDAPNALSVRMVWRAADGSILRVVRAPR